MNALIPQFEAEDAQIVTAPDILTQMMRGEVDMQVATAKRYPRKLTTFQREALSMATLDEDTAASCFYVLPRDGKSIEGPSARLAEIISAAWGNLRIDARVIDVSGDSLTAQAACWDVERNVAVRIEVRRRITGKRGRYNEDMINVTANAAISIALRNAVFKVVPGAYWKPIFERCKSVAGGDAQSLGTTRAKWIEYFGKQGVNQERVLNMLGAASMEDVTLQQVVTLQGVATAIREGSTTIEEVFADDGAQPSRPAERPRSLDDLKAQAEAQPVRRTDAVAYAEMPEQNGRPNFRRSK